MRTFALALLLALGMALVAPMAHAVSGTVTFVQRNYAVQIQANGDVQVVEHWQVRFSGGPFHTAHLDLHMLRTNGIDFGTVTGATPGSQHTSQTTDAAGNPMAELIWDYAPTQDTTRSFDIPYTIHGALQVGTDQAWLDWTFLDPGSGETLAVNSATVTMTLPADAPSNTLGVQATDPDAAPTTSTPDARTATASVQSVVAGDPFEVEVAFPRSLLAASVQRPKWQTSDTPPQLQQPQTGSGGGPYTGNPGSNGGSAPSILPGVSNLCGCGFIPLIIIGLIIFSLFRSFFGVGPRGGYLGRRWNGPWGGWGGWGGPWGPWYGGGPLNHPGGPWGGGGFGGGGMGGGGMGGGGGGFGGGAGGGGGGGGAGFG